MEKKINYKKKNSKRRYKIDVNTNIKIRIYFLKLSLFNYYIQSQNYWIVTFEWLVEFPSEK